LNGTPLQLNMIISNDTKHQSWPLMHSTNIAKDVRKEIHVVEGMFMLWS